MVHQTRSIDMHQRHQRASIHVRNERAPKVHQTCTHEHATMRECVRQRVTRHHVGLSSRDASSLRGACGARNDAPNGAPNAIYRRAYREGGADRNRTIEYPSAAGSSPEVLCIGLSATNLLRGEFVQESTGGTCG